MVYYSRGGQRGGGYDQPYRGRGRGRGNDFNPRGRGGRDYGDAGYRSFRNDRRDDHAWSPSRDPNRRGDYDRGAVGYDRPPRRDSWRDSSPPYKRPREAVISLLI